MSELERMKQQILNKKQESDEAEAKQPGTVKELERSSSNGSTGSESVSSFSSSYSDTKVEAVLAKSDAMKTKESVVEEESPEKLDKLFLDEKNEGKGRINDENIP